MDATTHTPERFTLALPFPPSVNHYWRHRAIGRGVQTYISPQGQAFRKEVSAIVQQGKHDYGIATPVAVAVTLHPPNKVRRDLDNYGGKALLDALTHAGVWQDDRLVHWLLVQWGTIHPGGSVEVAIEKYGSAQ